LESPALAVHFAQRFNSTSVTSELRWLLLNFPEKVLDEPDALEMLLGSSLPNDVSFQLKVLMMSNSVTF
jgi:phosphatidylinositol 4-kinase